MVWSYNSNDPSSFSQLAELIHEKKGSSSLNLLGGLSEDHVESDNESIQILNENVHQFKFQVLQVVNKN